MAQLTGLIPAAGMGTRAYPYTQKIPKGMLLINGVPNLERLICLMRDSLGIEDIYIVVGYYRTIIQKYFGDGAALGCSIHYLENNELEKGWAYSVYLARNHIRDFFCVMLSDECYIGTNHHELASFGYETALATCTVMQVSDARRIRKNYSVVTEGERVTRLVENPQTIINPLMGCGTFILHPQVFEWIEAEFNRGEQRGLDLISVLGRYCDREPIKYFELEGEYVNINDRDSLQLAKYHVRERIFGHSRTSLLIYSEGDEENLLYCIEKYLKAPGLEDVYLIWPPGKPVPNDVRATGVSILECPPGVDLYGAKLKYAIERTGGEIVVLTEASYSFHQRDLAKLRAYITECDMAIGTRTTRQLIDQGSNMRGVVRAANVMLAKLIEFLWWTMESRVTDVGCTFRAFWRTSYERIKNNLDADGPEFSVEMIIELVRARERVIEIPVSYYGRSYSMYGKYRNVTTFLRMFGLILAKRLRPPRDEMGLSPTLVQGRFKQQS